MKREFTENERDNGWALWEEGFGFSDIAHVLDYKPGSAFTILKAWGNRSLGGDSNWR
jgi:hypothetical protein